MCVCVCVCVYVCVCVCVCVGVNAREYRCSTEQQGLSSKNCSRGNSYVFILYSNKKLLIYHFDQETNSIVHLVEIVMFDIFLT